MNTPQALAQVRPGDYVRLKDTDTAPVWVRGSYDRASKSYTLSKADDMNHTCQRKGTALVFTGFTY
jgi:hypothetical protein